MKKNVVWVVALMIIALALSGCGFLSGSTKTSETAQTQASDKNTTSGVHYTSMEVPKGIPVLMYHKVGNDKDNDAVIAPDLFAAQMKFLKDHDFHPISLQQLYEYMKNGTPVPTKPVVLTFDDGYADTYSIVYPTLKKYGFAGTVFINAGDVGTRLTWAQIKEMHDDGIVISNHGYNHERMAAMNNEQQYLNIKNGQDALQRQLGIDNKWFCYPYGSNDANTRAAAEKNGILLAVTMNPGWAHVGDDLLKVQRIWIGNAVDIKHFEERITTENYTDL